MDFTIEELSMNAWPSLRTLIYDGWVIRMSNGYGNRANSINPIYPSRIKLETKLKKCDELFTANNLLPAYKLLGCEEHEAMEKKLVKMNYLKINETSIQVCKIPKTFQSHSGIIIRDSFMADWIKSVVEFNRIEEKNVPTFRKILDSMAVEKIVVHKEIHGKIAGCGYGAIENNHVGLFDIVVKEEERGKGFGREIIESILCEAARRGVKNTYLQVMINNHAALHLYKKLGYREIYRYWYRKKGSGTSAQPLPSEDICV